MGSQEIKRYIPSEVRAENCQVISVNGEINVKLANKFVEDIEEAANDQNRIIVVTINSNGGLVDAGLDIVHAINRVPNTVRTLISRKSNSTATLISASGTIGERYAWEGTEGLIHLPRAEYDLGKVNIVEAMKKLSSLKTATHEYLDTLQRVTGLPESRLLSICLEDRYLTASEMLNLNIIDHIIPFPGSEHSDVTKSNGFSSNGLEHMTPAY